MSKERLAYIKAVKCILEAPSKFPAGKYPGAKSRYDDFVVVHMNTTPSVHGSKFHALAQVLYLVSYIEYVWNLNSGS